MPAIPRTSKHPLPGCRVGSPGAAGRGELTYTGISHCQPRIANPHAAAYVRALLVHGPPALPRLLHYAVDWTPTAYLAPPHLLHYTVNCIPVLHAELRGGAQRVGNDRISKVGSSWTVYSASRKTVSRAKRDV